MKLGMCRICKDVFKLVKNVRECSCGKCSGVVKGSSKVTVTGPIVIIGINDDLLKTAVGKRKLNGSGVDFNAYVLPVLNKSVFKIKPKKFIPTSVPPRTVATTSMPMPVVQQFITSDELTISGGDMKVEGEDS